MYTILSLLLNCSIWFIYGLLINNWVVYLPNLSAILFTSYYIYIYRKYTINTTIIDQYLKYIFIFIITNILIIIQFISLHHILLINTLGIEGSMLAIIFTMSPLAELKIIIQTKSTESLSRKLSILSFTNSIAWFIYGYLIINDNYIYIPNFIGSIFASFPVIMLYKYPSNTTNLLQDNKV